MIKESLRLTDETLMEGMVSVRAVLDAAATSFNNRTILNILYAEENLKKRPKEYSFLRAKGYERGFEIDLVPKEEIEKVSLGTTHGGVLAECSDRIIPTLSSSDIVESGFYVMLEGIEDPYNFGYALRSLYAAGVSGVILTPRNWMSAAGVVCRSSAGASERLPMYISEPEQAAAFFHEKKYKVVAADTENSVSVYGETLTYPIFLIIGGEKRGISAKTLASADLRVRLDYARTDADALSAASAASILAFEIFRQNLAGGKEIK